MAERYDAVILGGAFSGASTAILLRRELPQLRVLIVEKAEAFDEKVGEATTEMSAMFLTRRLALWQHLENEQLPKEGLRYWFSNDKVTGHVNASETGGFIRSTVPAFQLRRDALDEHMLATAVAEGAELWRPAKVRDVTIGDFDHRVTVEMIGETREVECRWVLDASGRVNFLGRRLNLIERNEEHPTAAIWCRWKNVRHIDDLAVRLGISGGNISSRRLGTNHYTGHGYWIWVIPLGNGETSIGVVFDKRLIDLHHSKNRSDDFIAFLKAIPALNELIDVAEPRLEDLRFYSHLPYATKQYMGRGWALLGDAAAFLDPYYSPGLDHASFTAEATVEIIKKDAMGADLAPLIAEHNETFVRSYWRFFRAAYKDKYYYMGEGDLLSAAMLIDTAQYYIFVVIPAYRFLKKFHWMPVLGPKPALISYQMMVLYNRRFKAIAEGRRKLGVGGLMNDNRRIKGYFNLGLAPMQMAARGVKIWFKAEVGLLWMRIFGVAKASPEPSASPSHVHPPASHQ
ncbi:MAG TPA: NAD(P)/FAD-dependent oxidoreductase [Thermoanaerobaculia bacterium]|jgi:flavin-dependent dehydrogenase|nr:NAD(P)/FAD-dependent oxidoreductase [Thermoanaerobaculia bacterium]